MASVLIFLQLETLLFVQRHVQCGKRDVAGSDFVSVVIVIVSTTFTRGGRAGDVTVVVAFLLLEVSVSVAVASLSLVLLLSSEQSFPKLLLSHAQSSQVQIIFLSVI